MTTTLVAVFENADGAEEAVAAIRARGLAREVQVLGRRADGPEQGTNPVITGPGYGLGAPDRRPPAGEESLGAGVAVGATIGGTVGLLASEYIVPGAGTLVGVGPLVSTVVGAGIGTFLGALTEYTGTETDATLYPGTVRLGGVLVAAVCDPQQVGPCRTALEQRGPLELREHPGGPAGEQAGRVAAATNAAGTAPGPVGTSQAPGQVAGGLALTGGARRETGARGPLRGEGATPGEVAGDRPTRPGEGQPGQSGAGNIGG